MTSLVGALTVPVTVGSPADILDPFVVGLADYLRFWIRDGITTATTAQRSDLADPLPAANVFYYDPANVWVRNATPALYLWWPKNVASRVRPYSTVYDMRERELRLLYVLTEAVAPDGMAIWSGMPADVDAIIAKASARGAHPSYGYNGAAVGTPIAQSLAPLGVIGWEYTGGAYDFAAPIPAVSEAIGGPAEGHVTRGFPVLLGTLRVLERIQHEDRAASDLATDLLVTINTSETDPNDTVEYKQGYLKAPPDETDV